MFHEKYSLQKHANAIYRDVQYTDFLICKLLNAKILEEFLVDFFFYIFAQNIDCGYTLVASMRF